MKRQRFHVLNIKKRDLLTLNAQHCSRGLLAELQALVVAAQSTGHTWLSGAHFGPLDAYALTLTRWGSLAGIDPQDYPVLWAFVNQVATQTAVAHVIERERLQLNLFKPA